MRMTAEEFERERQYQTVMHFVRKLLEEGLISEEEYCQIDTRNLEKWGPKTGSLLRKVLDICGKQSEHVTWKGGMCV